MVKRYIREHLNFVSMKFCYTNKGFFVSLILGRTHYLSGAPRDQLVTGSVTAVP